MRRILLMLAALLVPGCSVDAEIQRLEVPVDQVTVFASVIVLAFPQADLDGNGMVPSDLAELVALFQAIRSGLPAR